MGCKKRTAKKGLLAKLSSKMDRQVIGLSKPTVFGSFLRPLRNQDKLHE